MGKIKREKKGPIRGEGTQRSEARVHSGEEGGESAGLDLLNERITNSLQLLYT